MRRNRLVAALIAGSVLAAGCSGQQGLSVQDVPLPGGADLGSHPYTLTIELNDVLSLVPQASVKVNDVPVGRVTDIRLPEGKWTAEVTVKVNGKVRLPANATANIEQSSLLGEKYIQLAAPTATQGAPSGTLANGSRIPIERTGRDPETEEVFGALSMLLNGGGLPQLRTITRELNSALNGRETQVRNALRRLNDFTSSLDGNRTNIVRALESLNRLSATIASRKGQVDTILTDLAPGLKVLEEQRADFVRMLEQLDELSEVATRISNASRDDIAASLRALEPSLRKLADAGRDLPKSLEVLMTFPFTDQVMAGARGDYLNVYATVVAKPGSNCVNAPVKPETTVRLKAQDPAPQGPVDACPPAGSGGQTGSAQTGAPPLPLPAVTIPPGLDARSGGGGVLPDIDGGN
ncbi:MCE family protein [Actinomadura rudentiformis]|uniref:MCE family protein n=1 Tax=Actinomadura rudentiformis TaxID=359158 RepID=UPI00178C6601|nr:MCE family protein [Actinomadura rudentiformis]